MKPEFTNYLGEIGMGTVLIRRVSKLERAIAAILPEEITHIFVSDYIDQEEQRQFENLYFLTPGYLVETRNFVAQQSLEVDLIRQSIINIQLNYIEYNFRSAAAASRLNFRYTTGLLGAELKASKDNCDHLYRILRECIIPNLAPSSVATAVTDD